MTIAVDFDGTIVEHRYPQIGRERPFAIDTLKMLAAAGHKLILWTAREGMLLENAVEYCRERGLEFYSVNSARLDSSYEKLTSPRKLVADIYIDDRNLGGIPDWNVIYDMITRGLTYSDMLNKLLEEPDEDRHFQAGRYRRNNKKTAFSWITDRCREARHKFGR